MVDTRFTTVEIVSRVVRSCWLIKVIGIRSAVHLGIVPLKRNPLQNAKLVPVTLPGFHSPFYLRAGTSDVHTFLQVMLKTEYDIRFFPQFQKLDGLYRKATAAGRRPLIIDCGANIGLSAVWFSRLFPEAQIFAVEPAADNVEVAKRNVSTYPNITLLHGAIWDHPARLTIADPRVAPWAYQVMEAQDGLSASSDNVLKAFTISELMDMAGAHDVLIAKIDIEGAEAALFRSNTEWVSCTDLIAIELHDWMLPEQRTSAPFIRSFANLNFDLLQRGENLFVFLDRPGA